MSLILAGGRYAGPSTLTTPSEINDKTRIGYSDAGRVSIRQRGRLKFFNGIGLVQDNTAERKRGTIPRDDTAHQAAGNLRILICRLRSLMIHGNSQGLLTFATQAAAFESFA